jgi:hypothetical protein
MVLENTRSLHRQAISMERGAHLDILDRFVDLSKPHRTTKVGITELYFRIFIFQQAHTTSESALRRVLVYLERVLCVSLRQIG